MAKKQTIFEEEWTENLYVKFESEHNTTANGIGIKRLSIIETMELGSPFLNMKLIDTFGDLMNLHYISPKDDYIFTLGRSDVSAVAHPFKLSVSNMSNLSLGKTENLSMDVTFISSIWDKNTKDTHCRGWSQMTYSAILEELMVEMGVEEYDIEPTDGVFDVIQPNWTNFQLIKWMSLHAVNTTGQTGYQYGFTSNGKFFFKTIDKLYSQKPVKAYFLGKPAKNVVSFGQFEIKHEYQPVNQQGGFGMEYEYFDYETKQWITGQKKYSETDNRQLSDWCYICKEHENAVNNFSGGRDTNTEKVAESHITNVANFNQKIEIQISGDVDVHVGDVIELLILSGQYTAEYIINEKYSGYWMINKVTHDVLFDSKEFKTYLTLTRNGYNGVEKDLKGFVKTTTGKKIAK
jgi:hypothetical protein